MTLSTRQFQWLQWIAQHGGKAYPQGLKLRAGNDTSSAAAAVTFVHLCAKGALVGRDGYLEITDYGRRLLTP